MEKSNTALILIDIQNDYFPAGKFELEGSPEAGQQAARLLNHFRQQAFPLVHIRHISLKPNAAFFLPGSIGSEIHASVKPLESETVIEKHFPNSFRETRLLSHLQGLGITRLVLAGMMSHLCVDATTRAAADLGFECVLAHNACATRALKFNGVEIPAAHVHGAFMSALDSYAKIMSVDEILELFF